MAPIRAGRRLRHTWTQDAFIPPGRDDQLKVHHWQRHSKDSRPSGEGEQEDAASKEPSKLARIAELKVDVPTYDDATYEQQLVSADWSREDTDALVETYRDCAGKWPVVADRYEAPSGQARSMEQLKARYYTVSAKMLIQTIPKDDMNQQEYQLYETLSNFDPAQETSRKQLAEGHLLRRQNEVDEETVLLGELQRIMVQQKELDDARENLRSTLDFPHPSAQGYQYGTSQQLNQLYQQLMAADRMKKNPRLRPVGTAAAENANAAPGPPSATADKGRRGTRDSLPANTAETPIEKPAPSTATDLTPAQKLKFGITTAEKLPSSITFASDKLHKPRIAKSTIQTDKIATILQYIGVPDQIPLPTPKVIEAFESVMSKVHALLDLRKLGEKEQAEIAAREAEIEKKNAVG
ncbi:hypothetical protein MBLNU230_g5652t1 [Neophaeotheca triangularis]